MADADSSGLLNVPTALKGGVRCSFEERVLVNRVPCLAPHLLHGLQVNSKWILHRFGGGVEICSGASDLISLQFRDF